MKAREFESASEFSCSSDDDVDDTVGICNAHVRTAMGKVVMFLFVAMPLVYVSLMMLGGWVMSNLDEWDFFRGWRFMASAITGGAIVFPHEPPECFLGRFVGALSGACGVGMFGFTIATLNHSICEPIVHALGMDAPKGHFGLAVRRLVILAASVLLVQVLIALLFGLILEIVGYEEGENMTFFAAFKTMSSVELGGGITFHGQAEVTGFLPRIVFCFIGCWTIGIATLVISVAGASATAMLEQVTNFEIDEKSDPWVCFKLLCLVVLLVLPIVLLTVMLVVGGIMSVISVWSFKEAFWVALPATTGGAASMKSTQQQALTARNAAVMVTVSSFGFFVISLFIGLGSELSAPIFARSFLGNNRVSPLKSLLLLLFGIVVMIPGAILLSSVPLGGILSLILGWEWRQGIWWCVAVQLGGGMQLTTATIETTPGVIFATIIVAWNIGISIMSVGIASSPMVEPLMDAMGMTVDQAVVAQFKATRMTALMSDDDDDESEPLSSSPR